MSGLASVDELEGSDHESSAPVWPAFGDLMACLFGVFVLFFVWAMTSQASLSDELAREKRARAAEHDRLAALERALAGPLAAGTITLDGGTIGIRGNVLFGLNSAELRDEGVQILDALAGPLRAYLDGRDEMIMVSGFTDDLPLGPRAGFKDNWELSAERALTVTRTLMAGGVPQASLFAAGFGPAHPVASNASAEGRARNRRVEIAPMPRAGAVK
jgi:flagellar motor protein MotB